VDVPPPRQSFVPKFTLIILGAVALTFVLALLYSAPIWTQEVPPGTPHEVLANQVRDHLAGKMSYFFMFSLLLVAVLVARPWKK
jgi:hypothetical protein